MIEMKESRAFILENMDTNAEIRKEQKEHKKSLTKSRVAALKRVKVARAVKEADLIKKKEESV